MNKFFSIAWIFLVLTGITHAQDQNFVQVGKASVQLYGFVRSEYYYDSYKGVNAAQDNFYLVPLYKGQDGNGEDLNRQGITGFTAMATRFGMNITGPEILGAKSSANFETDFAGIVSCYPEVLRLRKAYVKLDWEKTSLLVGQTWHPLWNGSGAFFPQVGGLNTGSPYNPFNRSPQVDFDYRMSKTLTLSLTALYEQQYASKGFYDTPNTNSTNLAKRNAGIPELVAGLYYNSGGVSVGVAGAFNVIQPIDVTEGTEGKFKTEELNTSFVGMTYLGYKSDKLFVLAKGMLGQNMVNMLMLGGYGVKDYDAATGAMTYTNYSNYSSLLNIVYGNEYQVGFLAGLSGNLGTAEELYNFDGAAKTLGLMPNIKQACRVAPYFAYNYKNLRFVAEYELDSADYGTGNFDFKDGLYEDTTNATNHRILLMLMYNF
ncbi:hypothetical protein [Maribellus sp. YY47]|uniref:hypothetical protein n=1 Tax=Maribellus sp. YY47 TaxID=2929486 RepID=UPI002000CD70|nr:hypothetical protein [Maribellus sp. YY47]MCK3684106.1 hypothetical protein [Maribellus sp. YY47]